MKIVIAEKMSAAAVELLREPGWEVIGPEQINGDLEAQLEAADALIVRSAVQVTAALLDHAPKLRVIGRAGVGVDNIELEPATRRGIAVMNTPGANAVAVAEYTLSAMLAMARFVCRANRLMHDGKWEKKTLQGNELRGKTLGIVGLGKIGMEVAKRAQAFQMNVIGHDPFVAAAVAKEHGVQSRSLEEVLSQADYLTLHLGLTPQTVKMVNAESIRKMKKGVRIVNCARGELIDEPALAAALKDGQVTAAALDVFAQEPLKESPLRGLDNVLLTPHIGGSTHEAQEAVGVQIAMQVKEYLKNGVIQNAVNVPSVSHEEYVTLQPYVVLAEQLGSFLAQVRERPIEEIFLTFSGEIAKGKLDLVRNSAISGILNQSLEERANVVNAAAIASSHGLSVKEEKNSGGREGVSAVTVRVKGGGEEHAATGSVVRDESRLLHLDGIDIETPLAENMIYLRNEDVPGVIGRVGTVLGSHNINIANFALGRRSISADSGPRDAVAVIQTDGVIAPEALAELRSIPAVRTAKAVRLADARPNRHEQTPPAMMKASH